MSSTILVVGNRVRELAQCPSWCTRTEPAIIPFEIAYLDGVVVVHIVHEYDFEGGHSEVWLTVDDQGLTIEPPAFYLEYPQDSLTTKQAETAALALGAVVGWANQNTQIRP